MADNFEIERISFLQGLKFLSHSRTVMACSAFEEAVTGLQRFVTKCLAPSPTCDLHPTS
jgi:hypothetical protein